jgi:hypothetical protein
VCVCVREIEIACMCVRDIYIRCNMNGNSTYIVRRSVHKNLFLVTQRFHSRRTKSETYPFKHSLILSLNSIGTEFYHNKKR